VIIAEQVNMQPDRIIEIEIEERENHAVPLTNMSSVFASEAAPLAYVHKQLQVKGRPSKRNLDRKLYSVKRQTNKNQISICRESANTSEKDNQN